MKTSLFTQSLWAVGLEEAIEITGDVGFDGIELACCEPHLTLALARSDAPQLLRRIKQAGLKVSALSLFTHFTSAYTVEQQLESAIAFIECAPAFETDTVKITPGPPRSADVGDEHWSLLREAISRLAAAARGAGGRLAVETHLGQVSDTVDSVRRIVDMDDSGVVGVNLDFCNIAFAGDDPVAAVEILRDRLYLTHVKNGYLGDGGYDFRALDEGMVDYPPIIRKLREVGFDGYLSIECLGPSARSTPHQAVKHDYDVLRGLLGLGRARSKRSRAGYMNNAQEERK